jgi:hypothetical protein
MYIMLKCSDELDHATCIRKKNVFQVFQFATDLIGVSSLDMRLYLNFRCPLIWFLMVEKYEIFLEFSCLSESAIAQSSSLILCSHLYLGVFALTIMPFHFLYIYINTPYLHVTKTGTRKLTLRAFSIHKIYKIRE